ncbi:MAG: hypothetical protein KME20_17430 [Kaiparowitsia implicata GSE-PSE-MK54-09C]|jgi:hypothetical protein|nr:hypothetical protein [Kaiparowitsia implicata GSE-PSE-MK54-09C]
MPTKKLLIDGGCSSSEVSLPVFSLSASGLSEFLRVVWVSMPVPRVPFQTANDCFRKADHARWQRLQSKRHILRSQLGFNDALTSQPPGCQSCRHHHGVAYGYGDRRTVLVCGMHPYGWQGRTCPDWQAEPSSYIS